MPTRLVFPGKQQVELESFTLPEIKPGQAHVKTICSLVSTGTEGICFNRNFADNTGWAGWVKYPFYPGYATIGTVVAACPDTDLKPGQVVMHRRGHCSDAVVDAGQTCPVPADISPESASWFALAKIASMGARAGQFALGKSILIIGAGPVGQMAIRWAACSGCYPIISLDTVQSRLDIAKQGGATHGIALPADQAKEQVLAACGGKLPEIVVDATGYHAVLPHAISLTGNLGRVVILGDTGFPEKQHINGDVINRGLTIVGAHDTHENEYWNSAKVFRLFLGLIQQRRFNADGLITHRFKPEQCKDVYNLMNERRPDTMGILFNWESK